MVFNNFVYNKIKFGEKILYSGIAVFEMGIPAIVIPQPDPKPAHVFTT